MELSDCDDGLSAHQRRGLSIRRVLCWLEIAGLYLAFLSYIGLSCSEIIETSS